MRFLVVVSILILLLGCSKDPKFQQYYVQGETLYVRHCSNCHQPNGKGLGLIYPPLDQSDFMEKNLGEVICLIRYGKEGEILVNGKSYQQAMPGLPALTSLEIAEITTYIYNSWDHQQGLIGVQQVEKQLDNCP